MSQLETFQLLVFLEGEIDAERPLKKDICLGGFQAILIFFPKIIRFRPF